MEADCSFTDTSPPFTDNRKGYAYTGFRRPVCWPTFGSQIITMRKRFRDRDWSDPNWQTKLAEFEQTRNRNKVTFGIVLAVIGLIWVVFIKFNIDFNIEDNWPLVLFVIGLLSGLKSNFRNNAWWILWL
ncbi:MAG: hypothetical protein EBZ77_09150, partial [Chitinophagia bacterium]|nr:hypothetical protein [Chitinophagia bacterium]